MLDIKVIRENPDLVRQAAIKKRFPDRAEAVEGWVVANARWRCAFGDVCDPRRAVRGVGGRGGAVFGSGL